MRSKFDEQLQRLNDELVEMGAMCESAIATAVKALMEGDESLAKQTVEAEQTIDKKELDIEQLCLRILLQQQPVARDLRTISAALKMVTDMERIGDQAADVCEITLMGNVVSYTDTVHIGDMARAAIKMVTDSIDAFVRRDLELARAVIDDDDIVDNLFDEVKKQTIELVKKNGSYGETAADLLMIAKYLERIADHAVNIAEWVVFSITGQHKSI